ncbi:hypothetical protein I6F35_22335 [Bradyrhizobium sp. BRP22]|uniref:hypothetical protein n=1 Tax=Bradyrhizobium sp. BRP22 TaxID=2793821 RepID=UPI001CD77A6A|nr:hypothetical protein [Bradyrhizobium sp. BRP22]MCA1455908.1 hypothetical protein [Bradyrhizobium sp. BRP22]
MTVLHSPPNELLRIYKVYLFVSVDEHGEGVCAAPVLGPGTVVPLIAADQARLRALLPWAGHIAEMSGKPIKLLTFTSRAELMTITPDGPAAQ